MSKKTWYALTISAILVAGYAIVQYFILGTDKAGLVQLKLMFMDLDSFWYFMLFLHIVGGILALILGPFNLSTKFREKNWKRHRVIGIIYMFGILLAGISGLYLAFFATGGIIAKIGFGLLSVLWLVTAFMAIKKIKNKSVLDHQKHMIRNYSLTFAAVTLRIWLGVFILLFGYENYVVSYMIIAWLCWVPNLIVAEFIIKRKLKQDIVTDVHESF